MRASQRWSRGEPDEEPRSENYRSVEDWRHHWWKWRGGPSWKMWCDMHVAMNGAVAVDVSAVEEVETTKEETVEVQEEAVEKGLQAVEVGVGLLPESPLSWRLALPTARLRRKTSVGSAQTIEE
jgi:hypothetical protein